MCCRFGTDQGQHVAYRSSDSAAATSTQGWLHIHEEHGSSHIANQGYHHAWNLKLYGEDQGLTQCTPSTAPVHSSHCCEGIV